MGSYYRERHQQPASTTSQDLAGPGASPAADVNLDDMTKAELLEHARTLDLDVKQAQSKDEIRAAIDAA